jgi:ribonucleoside-diphosphate reductase alpha chain
MVKNLKPFYTSYEAAGKVEKTIKAHELWKKILESQVKLERHMLYKDTADRKSNQEKFRYDSFFGLCTEIMEYFER